MATAKPVVAARIEGLADLVADGETGFLVPTATPPSPPRGDGAPAGRPPATGATGATAGQRLERYLARTVVPRFEAVYRRVLQPGPRKRGAGPLPAGLGEGPTR